MAEITKELGRIPVSRGDYQSTTEYYKDNIVQYKRGSYQVVSESPIIGVPPTNDKNIVNPSWTLFAGTLDAQDVVNQIKEQEAKSIQAVAAREVEILAKSDASKISSSVIGLEGSNVEDKLTNASNKLSELETKVIYDVSEHNNGAVFESLSALLSSSSLDTLIPTSVRKGGMSIKFIQSSDNKYVQYMYVGTSIAVADFINTDNWERTNLQGDVLKIDKKIGTDIDVICPIPSNGEYVNTDFRLEEGEDVGLYVDADAIVATGITIIFYIYKQEGGGATRKRIQNKQQYASLRTLFDDYSGNIYGFAYYITGMSGTGNVVTTFKYYGIPGELNKRIDAVQLYAERKIEELAWIGTSSAGKNDWAIGDKIFNTTKNKLAICTVPSPNQDFGPDYDASENSLYIYKGLLYHYNGTTLVEVDGKKDGDVDYVKDTIDGSFTKTYNVTSGTEVDGTSLSSPYIFPIKIGKGCKFTVLKTSSVISSIPIYAIGKDNQTASLKASTVGTELNLVAPFDMVAIGVYIAADKISADGTYTMKVTTDALWETQKKVEELEGLSDDVKGLQYKTDLLPSNSMFESSDFVNGDLYHGSIHSQDTWRVCMAEKHTTANDIYLSAKTGFRFVVEYFVSDVYSGESGWKTNYMIPSGSVYQIKIARTTDDTTEIADINLFVSKVTFPTDFYSEFSGIGSLGYYGKKIPSLSIFLNQFNCKEETLVAELAPESGQPENVNRYTSGMVVCKGKAFCFGDTMEGGSKCTIFDLSDFSQTIVTLPWSAHNNNAQPTPYYYDANDTYPLMLVSRGDYASAGAIGQKFYFVRVVESGGSYVFTIVKEVSYSGFLGEQYNVSWFANYEKGELWCYTYPVGSWATRTNNPNTFYKFDLSLVSPASGDYSNATITGSDIKDSIVLQDHWITQSALYHDGKIFIQTEADSSWDNLTINGEPYDASKGLHFLFIIDAQSGYIETIVPLHNDIEQEGLCIYNGALYMSEKYTNAPVGRECFRLVRYTFD